MSTSDDRPPYLADLEDVYGPESRAAFGSAVFLRPAPADGDPAGVARDVYRHFVGDLWERYGEAAWMGPWRRVAVRPAGAPRDLVAELAAVEDAEARRSVPLVLEPGAGAARAAAALRAAFDADEVDRLEVFTLGDGEAMSGLLVAAVRANHVVALATLLD